MGGSNPGEYEKKKGVTYCSLVFMFNGDLGERVE